MTCHTGSQNEPWRKHLDWYFCGTKFQLTKLSNFGLFLGEGCYFFLFIHLSLSPPPLYDICLAHVKGLCQRELLSPVENTASSRCLLWCTSQLFYRMSYITGLIFHRGFLSSECPSRHLQEGFFLNSVLYFNPKCHFQQFDKYKPWPTEAPVSGNTLLFPHIHVKIIPKVRKEPWSLTERTDT